MSNVCVLHKTAKQVNGRILVTSSYFDSPIKVNHHSNDCWISRYNFLYLVNF